MIHHLQSERATLHGHFSRDLPPILTIDSGDTLVSSVIDADWGLEPHQPGAIAPRRELEGRVPGLDDGHALIGPIAVRGAQPGQTLEVQIKALRTFTWGFCRVGGKPTEHNTRLNVIDHGIVHAWTLDPDAGIGQNQHGHRVRLEPFLGLLGMPPDEPGIHSTHPPRPSGGNMDCKELVAGTTLYLPITVEGGLFSFGDGHAAQGDGEVGGTAIECGMDHAELTLTVRDDFPVTTPTANTPTAWITMGFDRDLDEATFTALEAMFSLIQRLHGLERRDAIALASVIVDMRITQIVNGVRGVHACLPHDRLLRA